MTKVDIVFSYRSLFKRILAWLITTMKTHKLKTLVVIAGLYAAHRTFGLYRSFQNTFNPLADMQSLMDKAEGEE